MQMEWLRVISAGSVSTAAVTTALALLFSTGTVANAKPKADPKIVYSNIPDKLPGNVASEGPEAYAFRALGDGVVFAPGEGGTIDKVSVVLSSWGCVNGHWYSGDCVTQPDNAKFSVAITLNIYSVYNMGSTLTQGSLLATQTQTFDIPYRPSSDANKCPSDGNGFSRWYSDKDQACYHGLAVPITFNLNSDVALPDRVIIGVAFNSSHYGPVPIGQDVPCYSSSGGCPYDSLNIGTDGPGGLVGSVIDSNGVFVNPWPQYVACTGTLNGASNLMQLDTAPGCWAGFHPLFEVVAKGGKKTKGKHDDLTD